MTYQDGKCVSIQSGFLHTYPHRACCPSTAGWWASCMTGMEGMTTYDQQVYVYRWYESERCRAVSMRLSRMLNGVRLRIKWKGER